MEGGMAVAFSAKDWIGWGICKGTVICISVTAEIKHKFISNQESLVSWELCGLTQTCGSGENTLRQTKNWAVFLREANTERGERVHRGWML